MMKNITLGVGSTSMKKTASLIGMIIFHLDAIRGMGSFV
jgi:hypothetical protein